jgi:hypothetical protein
MSKLAKNDSKFEFTSDNFQKLINRIEYLENNQKKSTKEEVQYRLDNILSDFDTSVEMNKDWLKNTAILMIIVFGLSLGIYWFELNAVLKKLPLTLTSFYPILLIGSAIFTYVNSTFLIFMFRNSKKDAEKNVEISNIKYDLADKRHEEIKQTMKRIEDSVNTKIDSLRENFDAKIADYREYNTKAEERMVKSNKEAEERMVKSNKEAEERMIKSNKEAEERMIKFSEKGLGMIKVFNDEGLNSINQFNERERTSIKNDQIRFEDRTSQFNERERTSIKNDQIRFEDRFASFLVEIKDTIDTKKKK